MNTKKASWINKPRILDTTLHSFSFEAEGTHSVFFTLGEEGEIALSKGGSAESIFLLLHTKNDYIIFGKKGITMLFHGVKSSAFIPIHDKLRLVKHQQELSFYDGDILVLRAEKDAFRTSASFGIAFIGPGKASLEVF